MAVSPSLDTAGPPDTCSIPPEWVKYARGHDRR